MTALPVPLEADEGKTLVAYLRLKGLKFHHSPNETGRTPEAKRRAIRMKQQGTSAGYPDYTIIVNGSIIFIELKRQRGSVTSQEQKDWIEALNKVDNVQAFIAKGANEAIVIIEKYINASRLKKPLELNPEWLAERVARAGKLFKNDIF